MRLLDDEAMSARAALHLGALQHRAAAPRLLAILKAGPKDPGPIIESLGAVGDDSAVQPVSRYLSTAEHFETAALALARIGTPSAKRILDGFAAQLRRDPRQAPRVEVLDRMRSKAFQDEDTGAPARREREVRARMRFVRPSSAGCAGWPRRRSSWPRPFHAPRRSPPPPRPRPRRARRR